LSFDIGEIDKTFELICEFNIYPDVSMPNYKKLNIKFQKTELSPLDVVHFIKEITKKDGMLVPKDSDTIENGDTVVFDFKGFINGSPFEGGESQFFELQIGSHQFIPGFEEQMIGLKKGEQKTIDVNFPNDYHAKDFAGKKAQFEINIRDIKLFQQQKLDDEYIKTLNIPKVNNKEDLENFVKCKLSYENHMTDNRNNIHLLYEFLIANVKLSYIPEFFIEKEINNINSNLSQQAEREEKTFDEFMMQKFNLKSNEEIKNEIRKQAQNNIILSLALDKMLKDLNIITSPTDRENFYEKISQVYNTDINEIKKTINKSDDDVDNIILEDKIIETIISIQE
jgi:trigger factor